MRNASGVLPGEPAVAVATSEPRQIELANRTLSMDTLLRKYQWVGRLLMIAAVVSLLALIANHIIAAQLAPLTVPKLPGFKTTQQKGGESNTSPTSNPDRWDGALSSRCLFGCADQEDKPKKCPGGCPDDKECKDGVCVPKKPVQQPESNVPVESDLNVKLMGCMVADNPDYSLAMIQDGKSQETYVVGPGDFLPGDARVERIERDRIYVRRNGRLEFIRLEKTIGGTPSPVSVNTGSLGNTSPRPSLTGAMNKSKGSKDDKPTHGADFARENNDEGGGGVVRKSSGNNYVLSGDQLERKLEDPKNVVDDIRIIPNFQKGKRQGLKVVGVSPNGLYSELGLESGDVIHSINGERLSKQSDAQRLVDGLRSSENFSVVVERDGQKVEKEYKIE